jgi:hypothetical protein
MRFSLHPKWSGVLLGALFYCMPAVAADAPPAPAPAAPAVAAPVAATPAPATPEAAATTPAPAPAAPAAAPAAAPVVKSEGSVLFVAPNRLTITPDSRSDVLNVSNKSEEERRYDLMLIDQVMGPNGVTQRMETFNYSAKPMLKFQPKRFTLKPGESQVVRVVVERPAGQPDGDYHSHLLFREVPLSLKDKAAQPEPAQKTVSFEIRTLYGIAIPVVVQTGKVSSDITLDDAKIGMAEDGKTRNLAVTFSRLGNAEAVGKFAIEYVAPGKQPVPVIDTQWLRIYHEVDKITRQFDLTYLPADAKGGKFVLTLVKDESDPSKTLRKEVTF